MSSSEPGKAGPETRSSPWIQGKEASNRQQQHPRGGHTARLMAVPSSKTARLEGLRGDRPHFAETWRPSQRQRLAIGGVTGVLPWARSLSEAVTS